MKLISKEIKSLCKRLMSHVSTVNNDRIMKVTNVKRQADNVPLGILFPGDTKSPDKLAPAIMPVTPENKTPKTVKKSTLAL